MSRVALLKAVCQHHLANSSGANFALPGSQVGPIWGQPGVGGHHLPHRLVIRGRRSQHRRISCDIVETTKPLFCCTKLQIPGLNALAARCNIDRRANENRSNSSRIHIKSGNRCVTMSTNDASSMDIKSQKSHPVARRFRYKSLGETQNSASPIMRRPQHRRKMMGWRSMHASNRSASQNR